MRAVAGTLVWLGLAALLAAPRAQAAPAADQQAVTETITKSFAALDKGDNAGFIASWSPDAVVIDDFAPFFWTGAGSLDHWMDALGPHETAAGISHDHLTLHVPRRLEIGGGRAWAVLPITYQFSQAGKTVVDDAVVTFVLEKQAGIWKIISMAWGGNKPVVKK